MSTKPEKDRLELLQGTLDLLILRTLLFGPAHGHAVAKAIERNSEDVLQVDASIKIAAVPVRTALPGPAVVARRRTFHTRAVRATRARLGDVIWGLVAVGHISGSSAGKALRCGR